MDSPYQRCSCRYQCCLEQCGVAFSPSPSLSLCSDCESEAVRWCLGESGPVRWSSPGRWGGRPAGRSGAPVPPPCTGGTRAFWLLQYKFYHAGPGPDWLWRQIPSHWTTTRLSSISILIWSSPSNLPLPEISDFTSNPKLKYSNFILHDLKMIFLKSIKTLSS